MFRQTTNKRGRFQSNHVRPFPQFVNIIRDCHVGGKAVVIVKGIDDWPGEFQKQYGFIDLYWIIRDGGLMLLLAMLLKSKKSFEGCKIRVFCTAEEEVEAEQLKADVKKFLYDLRMEAEVGDPLDAPKF